MKIRKELSDLIVTKAKETSSVQYNIDPTEYADLLFGVGSATSAGPTLPSGSIHPSPETLEKDNGGYTRNQPVVGFGQAYVSGSGGVKCYGNFLLAPMCDDVKLNDADRGQNVVKGSEIAKCYEYTARFENGIKTRVTPAHNTAIYEFEYPAGKQAYLLLDVARKLDMEACMKEGFFSVNSSKKTVCGGGLCTGNCNIEEWEMYFAMEIDTDFSEIGTFRGDRISLHGASDEFTESIDSMEKSGMYVSFGIPTQPLIVRVKIAISFVGTEQAMEFLNKQITGFDYDAVKTQAKRLWQNTMGAIDIKTDDKALLKRFYTAMYHTNIQPRNRVNDHGLWDDFHTIWDSWKTVFPLYSLIYPQRMTSIVESFICRAQINQEKNNGIVLGDQFMCAVESTPGQGGNDTDNAIADAYLKGIKLEKYDWEDAYKVLLRSAETMRSKDYIEKGYAITSNATAVSGKEYTWRFVSGTATLGFAASDKAVARVAKELGTPEEYEKYEKRSKNWLNVWNKNLESEGFFGFPQARNEDGSFDETFDAHRGHDTDFYEATAWDASYTNYTDSSLMVEVMGGPEVFTKRLLWACEHSRNYSNNDGGEEGYLNFTNEPSFQIPWLFCIDEVKRPDLAAKVINDVIKRFSLQDDYPGDEDNGGMSSFYIFMISGFFPYATTENYYLHGTRLEEIIFHLGNGRDFVITGENVGDENFYVQSATWQGKELNECKLTHRQILEGGELHFVMGDKPSKWATK